MGNPLDLSGGKEIEIFGRKYYVYPNGSIYTGHGKRVSVHPKGREYPYVEFSKKENGRMTRKRIFVHRLLAELYIPNPDNLPQINHIDGNKDNYSLTNLEWVAPSQNQLHSRYVLGNVTGFHDRSVCCIETGVIYKSTREAWRDTGAGYSHITECARGQRKTAGGYHWRYE